MFSEIRMPATFAHTLARIAAASAALARVLPCALGEHAYFGYWFSRARA